MKNYAMEWKKEIGLKQVSYNDFVSMDISNGIFSQKIDGMLGPLIFQKGRFSFFQTTTGKEISEIPALAEYEALFKKLGIKQAIIFGELVAQKGGTILPFNTSQSIIKTSYKIENKDLVFHYPIEIKSINGKTYSYRQSLSFLAKHINKIGLPHIRMPKIAVGGLKEFRKLFKITKDSSGYDGVVARLGNKNYKVKFIDTVDLVIMGAGNENMKSWPRGQVSYLLTAFLDKNNIYRSSSKVGTGFDQSKRRSLFDYINKNILYSKNGEFFVKPKVIIEVKYFRYRITDTPSYKFINKKYKDAGKSKSITFSNPSFIRLRPDKKVNKDDLRLEQIPEWLY